VGRHPEETKARILTNATRHFAANGFAGARMDEIASASRINKRMLYHYFDDKQGLYERVLVAQMKHMYEAIRVSHLPHEKPDSIIRHAIGLYFDYCRDHPDYIALMLWEMVSGWETLSRIADELVDPVHNVLIEAIDAGITQGLFDSGMNPGLFVAMATVQIFGFFPMLKHPHLVKNGRAVMPTSDEMEMHKQQMTTYLLRAIEYRPSLDPTIMNQGEA